ncbi:BhlA/UviB family holin-like peptide [Clostridium cochlearium]|uniref:BhlA/UviB family holin-like peptide n=1 Tax=Clostridium cochlearium TaxID=1494 RepID=UPI000BBC570C|nr:BhlA/UviB family holin-like peptide [Clostridium cochlearium]
MENLFLEIAKASPILALMLLFWFYNRKDYKEFVDKVQNQNDKREQNYQDIIKTLTEKFNLVEVVKKDVEDIKECVFKQ